MTSNSEADRTMGRILMDWEVLSLPSALRQR
jgi:hypothetical protein